MAVATASAENTTAVLRRILVAGDADVGKTHLIKAFLELNGTPDKFNYGIFYNSAKCDIDVDGSTFTIIIYPFPKENKGRRWFMHGVLPKADVVVMCFAANKLSSFRSVTDVWLNDIEKYNPTAPFVIVANKRDFRPRKVSRRAGQMLAKRGGAYTFIECSARTKVNVMKVFVEAVRATLANKLI